MSQRFDATKGLISGDDALPWLLLAAALLAVPALHPLLRPVVGVPSHLLWWIHVVPVALVTYRFGKRAGAATLALSAGLVIVGERWFGAGYGTPAPWETALSLAVAVAFVNVAVGSFAEYARRVTRRMRHRALHDELTGLPNRRHLKQRLRRRMARDDGAFALVFLDLDRFTRVNDTLGHSTGDEVLREVAKRLEGSVRPKDTVARWAGDEFVVLLERVADPDQALEAAARVQERIEQNLEAGGHELVLEASAGVAVASSGCAEPGDLLRNADTAMYRAKSRGDGRPVLFDPGMLEDARRRLHLESDLRDAVRAREPLELHYQPLVSLATGELTGLEGLVRWRHPERGLVPPAEFIPVAEETGLIVPLGEEVLRQAVGALRKWEERQPDLTLTLSVNVAAQQLHQPDFVETVQQLCRRADLGRNRLELEITETELMEQAEHVVSTLERLRDAGARITVDDFGTGYSSLRYLQQFPVDALKVDRSFVSGLDEPDGEIGIVQTIVALAEALELDTVAEGVEGPEQLRQVRELGCTRAQGFHIARPAPADEVEALLERAGEERLVPAGGAPRRASGAA